MVGFRRFLAITVASTAVMALFSCTRENLPAVDNAAGIRLEASIEIPEPFSKLSIGDNGHGPSLLWTKGDLMKVWPSANATAPIIFGATAFSPSTGLVSFESKTCDDLNAVDKFQSSTEMYAFSANSKANNAVNPFNRLSSDSSYSANKVIISSTQTAVAGSFDPEALPYVAHWSGSTPGEPQLELKLCCSLLKLHLDVEEGISLKSLTVTNKLSSAPAIAGSFNWKTVSGEVVLSSISNSSSEITLSAGPKEGVITSGDYYVIVASGRRFYHPTVTFTYGDGTTEQFDNYEIDIAAADMKRATIYDIGSFSLPKDPSKLERIRIAESDSWVRIHQKDYIVKGSILDFSSETMFDAPAGKYGRLKTRNGHFEFEGLPGKEQRFYGTNISNTVNYPTHDEAAAFADRMARSGYNLLRVHHYDDGWNTAENIDRLDFLISELIRRGIYITTDLYVSRSVDWRAIGFDKNGTVPTSVFKFLVGSLYAPALDNWKAFTKSFLEHVNPYTGHAYKDEPALCMISLVNEGGMPRGWDNAKAELPDFANSVYAEFKATSGVSITDRNFYIWFNSRTFEACSSYVRSLGCEALLTNDNNGQSYHKPGGSQEKYDYVDEHYYCAATSQPITATPFYINNYKPIEGEVKTASEWNHNAPSRMRAVGAIRGISELSAYGWNSVCRFAFAEHLSNLVPSDTQAPTDYCICKDELMLASEPAAVVFFGRRDVTSEDQIKVDASVPSLTVATDKSIAVWRESGTASAGILSADISGVPAVVFACAFNGEKLASASRILLVHMTDVQGIGSILQPDRTEHYLWGSGQVVEVGSADISLALNAPSAYSVYAVDASGERVGEISSSVSGGRLCFRVSTSTGILRYEITKNQ